MSVDLLVQVIFKIRVIVNINLKVVYLFYVQIGAPPVHQPSLNSLLFHIFIVSIIS